MARVSANGIELEVETHGQGEPLLLIMGLGAQLVHWPDGLVERLAARGFQVIRFDNRDVGRSTHLDHLRAGRIRRTMARYALGLPVTAPYTLADMADDTAGLLDALGLPAAHVVGASMGGMIAQMLAITHPHRVRSLTSIMSSPGGRRFMLSRPGALAALFAPPARTREQAVENEVEAFKRLRGRRYGTSEAELRATAERAWERGVSPRGFVRQLTAILASPERSGALRFVRAPAAVIHGSDDPLILPGAGRATARAIPGARWRLVEGMGHDLSEGTWGAIVGEIEAVAQAAQATTAARSSRRAG
jgi:pimeloyl-ACP methyl ester carboxylesterase